MSLQQLYARKAKADSLTSADRERYAEAYDDLLQQIQAELIRLSYACDDFHRAFADDCEINKDSAALMVNSLADATMNIAELFGVEL